MATGPADLANFSPSRFSRKADTILAGLLY